MRVRDTGELLDLLEHAIKKYTYDYLRHETTTGSKQLTVVFQDGETYNITITRARKQLGK